jgi:hypothetical protein
MNPKRRITMAYESKRLVKNDPQSVVGNRQRQRQRDEKRKRLVNRLAAVPRPVVGGV